MVQSPGGCGTGWGLLAERAAAAEARHWEGGELGDWERTEHRSAGNGIVVGRGLEPTEAEPVHNEGRSTQTYADLKGAALLVMHPHPPLSLFFHWSRPTT